MSDRAAYRELVNKYPHLFRNPPDSAIEILLDDAEIEQAEQSVAEKLRQSGQPVEWAQVGVAFRDQYLFLIRDAVRFANGSLGTYIRTIDPAGGFPGVVMLPVWNGQVLLVRHFRHATRAWHLELPRGFGESEDALSSAAAELAEELGAEDVKLTDMGQVLPDASADSTGLRVFYAAIGSYSGPGPGEAIKEILPIAVAEFERMIREGELTDGYTIMAFGLAKARGVI